MHRSRVWVVSVEAACDRGANVILSKCHSLLLSSLPSAPPPQLEHRTALKLVSLPPSLSKGTQKSRATHHKQPLLKSRRKRLYVLLPKRPHIEPNTRRDTCCLDLSSPPQGEQTFSSLPLRLSGVRNLTDSGIAPCFIPCCSSITSGSGSFIHPFVPLWQQQSSTLSFHSCLKTPSLEALTANSGISLLPPADSLLWHLWYIHSSLDCPYNFHVFPASAYLFFKVLMVQP